MAIVRCYACDRWYDPTDGEYDEDTLEFWCQDCLFTREAEEEADTAFNPLDKD